MTMTRRSTLGLIGASAAATVLPAGAMAQGTVHEVEMLNSHPDSDNAMLFRPRIIQAQPGDTIRFLSVDPAHNSKTYDGMLPDGAEGWNTPLSQDADVVVEVEGAYGYHCVPHKALGMVGLILVGDASVNYESLKEVALTSPMEEERWAAIFAEADQIVGA